MIQTIPFSQTPENWEHVILVNEDHEVLLKSKKNYGTPEKVLQRVSKHLLEHQILGYLNSEIKETGISNDTLNLLLIKGKHFKIETIRTDGFGNTDKKTWESAENVLATIKTEIGTLENNGFPFAEINTKSSIDNNTIKLDINLSKGPFIQFDSLIIIGEQSIDYKSLTKLLNFKTGTPYSETYINEIQITANANKYFELSQPTHVIFRNNTASVVIKLKNKKSSKFDGIVGIQPSDVGSTSITGLLNLELINSLKKGEEFSINWERLQSQNQRLNMRIKTPFIFRSLASINGSVDFIRQDSTINRANYSYGVNYRLNSKTNLNVSAGSTINNSNQQTNDLTKNTRINNYKSGITYTSLNNKTNPTSGAFLEITGLIGNRKTPDESTKISGVKASVNKYIKFKKRTSFLTALKGETINSSNLFENETLLIGGLGTIRGTDQRSIPATSWITGTIELKYLLDKGSSVFLFYDKNFFEKRTIGSFNSGTINSTGIGFSIGTKTGAFSFVYGISDLASNTILIRNAKINFGYVSTF